MRKTLKTGRGTLTADDPTITLEDLAEAYFGGKESRMGVTTCIKRKRPDLANEVWLYSTKNGLEAKCLRQAMVNIFTKVKAIPVCELCGKPARFNPLTWSYARFCSAKCQNNSPSVKKKHEDTNISVYGVKNAAMNASVKEKMRSTLLQKYGATCYLSTPEGKMKSMDSVRKHFGVDFSMQAEEVQEKRTATMLQRYGVEHSLQNPDIMAKRDATCIDRFGKLYPGVEKLKELATRTRLQVWDSLPEIFPDYEIQCQRESFLGVYDHVNTWKCISCGNIITRVGAPFCPCHLKWKEQENLYLFIKDICPDAEFRNRSVLGGKELDVYVPSKSIAFEYDGLYWHSEENGKGRRYHVDKTDAAAKSGVRLIHIFEDEWLERQEITKDFISSTLSNAHVKRVYARSCRVKMLNKQEAYGFFNDNHVLGAMNSPVNIGLVHDGKIVAACAFKMLHENDGSWYLERYASLLGCRVLGGCGKLLSFFVKMYSPSRIRTFADKRWSVGNMYEKIGFGKIGETAPVYWYIRNGAPHRIHRFRLRKKNKKMFDAFYDPSRTEAELARLNGYSRVWDCGQIVYELKTSS